MHRHSRDRAMNVQGVVVFGLFFEEIQRLA